MLRNAKLRFIIVVLGVILLHFFLLLNSRFTLWPEMIVYPYLLNNDFLLYRDIINPYPPFLTWFLAFFSKIFGYFPFPYQILTWVIILIIDLSIFLITKKLFKKTFYALLSTSFFIFFSIPFGVNGLWFDLVQTPFILWALYFFWRFLKTSTKSSTKFHLFNTFLLLAIAFFIKQQVAWVVLLFLVVALARDKFKVILFLKIYHKSVLPFVILLFLLIVYFSMQDNLHNFIFWVFYFPAFLASKMPGYVLLPSAKQMLVVLALFVLLVPTMVRKSQILFLVTPAVLILFAYPRFDYFHIIPALAAIAIFFGPNFEHLKKSTVTIKVVFLLTLIFLCLFTFRYFQNHWHKEIRFFEQEVLKNARVMDLIVKENETVYLQNAPDQLLPLSGTVPSKPWADDFPWYLEVQNLQNKVTDSLEKNKPRYIIFQPYLEGKKYELGSYRPDDIADYIDNNYVNFAQIDHDLYFKARK